MNLELRIWIWPGFSVSVCGCVGWVCGGVVWERIGCRWLHAFLPQQEGEQAPVIYFTTVKNSSSQLNVLDTNTQCVRVKMT